MMEPPARHSRWAALFTFIVLLVCYVPTLRGMANQWWNDEDMGHGFVVPIVILWILWRERDRWIAIPSEPSWLGVPIVAANLPDYTDVLRDGETAVLVNDPTPESLADALESLGDYPAGREKIIQQAAHFVHHEGSWEKTVDRFLDVYREAAGRGN